MPGHTTPNVRSTDDMAGYFKQISYRLASLERSVSSGSGGGGSGDADLAHWNSAWGIIPGGFGVMKPYSGQSVAAATDTDVANTITVTLVAGRRYKITGRIRAVSAAAQTSGWLRIVGNGVASNDTWTVIGGSYDHFSSELVIEATVTGTAQYRLVYNAATATTIWVDQQVSFFRVEDMGPTAPAASTPPQGQPVVVAAGNAIGVVARSVGNTATEPITVAGSSAARLFLPITATFHVGRRYRVSMRVRAVRANGGGGAVLPARFYVTESSAALGTSLWGFDWWSGMTEASWWNATFDMVVEGDGVTRTIQPEVSSGTAGVIIYQASGGSYFQVEDIGPNTTPALPIPPTDPPWTAIPWATGWRSYSFDSNVDPGAWGVGRYRKVGDWVTLTGLATRDTTGAQLITVMPVGFRPKQGHVLHTLLDIAGSAASPALVRVDIYANGNLQIGSQSPAANVAIGYFTLDGLGWPTS